MKKFLSMILIFAATFLVVDRLLILVRDSAPKREVDRRLELILDGKVDKDILILGSSRGARSVIAKVFTDSLALSAYNFAYPGSDVTFHEYVLRLLLANKKNKIPQSIILVVDDSDELQVSKSLKFRLDRLYPLVGYRSVRDEMVRRKEKKWLVNELLVAHQLNKSNFLFKQKKFTKNDSIMPCGSMPISHQKKTFDKKYKTVRYTYSREKELIQKIKAFRSITKMCKENNIRLIVAIPPNFRLPAIGFDKRLKQVMGGYGYVWCYDTNNPVYKNSEFFFDNAHLQTNGSYVYTNELVAWYGSEFKIR